MFRRVVVAAAALALVVALAPPAPAAVVLPSGAFDYQLGGGYPPPAGVNVVVRDRTDAPAPGRYNVCYVNAFQAQESERAWWDKNHPNLLLRDVSGHVVVDTAWNEALLDVRTSAKRSALLTIEGKWIDGCGAAGFKAIDPDNLDSYTRSKGLVTAANAVAFAKLLITRAHQRSLAISQKNAVELSSRAPFDFAVAEECQRYHECGGYKNVFGSSILEIEYTDAAFGAACSSAARTWPVIRRDVNLAPTGVAGHVYRSCAA